MAFVIPTFLNFNRSIAPSDALIFGVKADGARVPVVIDERTVRGAIGNFDKTSGTSEVTEGKAAKVHDLDNANIQRIDAAFLPRDCERILVTYSLIVQANSLSPSGCNAADIRDRLTKAAARYSKLGGYDLLANRYAWNIVNARSLWRNRVAKDKVVSIKTSRGTELKFSSDAFPLNAFPEGGFGGKDFATLSTEIAEALSGKSEALFLEVSVSGALPTGAEVFPSQEFIGDGTAKREKGSKGKTLSSIPVLVDEKVVKQATLHAQKVGNAIRTIDQWHPNAKETGATAVEVYGYSQTFNGAFRKAMTVKKADAEQGASAYAVLLDFDNVEKALTDAKSAEDLKGDIHFIFAIFVRGGVFSKGA